MSDIEIARLSLADAHDLAPLVAAYAPDLFLAVLASILLWGISRR